MVKLKSLFQSVTLVIVVNYRATLHKKSKNRMLQATDRLTLKTTGFRFKYHDKDWKGGFKRFCK